MDEKLPKINIPNAGEALGNFRNIFGYANLKPPEFTRLINQTGKLKKVQALEYFEHVGNGMNTQTQREEVRRIVPENINDPKHRAQIALDYIADGNHIGVSQDQFERDFAKGKDHDATMKYLLAKVLNGKQLEPCVVVKTKKATDIYGAQVEKVILDGTHRAVVAAVTNTELPVIEFSLDE